MQAPAAASPDGTHRLITRPSSVQVTPLHWQGGVLAFHPSRPRAAENASQLTTERRNASSAAAAGEAAMGAEPLVGRQVGRMRGSMQAEQREGRL